MRRVPSVVCLSAVFCLIGCQSTPTATYRNRALVEWTEDLKTADTTQRVNAARAIGSMGSLGEPALPALSATLLTGPHPARAAAADALGAIGVAGGASSLIRALKDPAARVRRSAAESLGRLKAQAATAPLLALLEHDPDRWVQRAAGNALGAIGRPACDGVLALLDRDDQALRERAARALGRMGGGAEVAVPALIRSLGDRGVQQHAARALGEIGEDAAAAIPALTALFVGDHAPWARRRAAEALGKIGRSALPSLVMAIALSSNDPFARIHGSRALGSMREDGVDAAPVLCWLLRDDRREVRAAAARGLREIGEPAVPALIQALLERKNEHVVQETCRILGGLGEDAEEAVPVFIRLLTVADTDPWVRACAVNGLGDLGKVARRSVPTLRKIVGCEWPDPNWLIRAEAAVALGKVDDVDTESIPLILRLLKDLSAPAREAVASALGGDAED